MKNNYVFRKVRNEREPRYERKRKSIIKRKKSRGFKREKAKIFPIFENLTFCKYLQKRGKIRLELFALIRLFKRII